MEIRQYWHVAGARRWLLVVVPVVAGATVAAVILGAPPRYAARVTVRLPVEPGAPPGTVAQAEQAFAAAATSASVAETVEEAVGAGGRDIDVRQIGTTDQAVVRVTAAEPDLAAELATAVAEAAIGEVTSLQIAAVEAIVEQAEERLVAARAELDAFSDESGLVVPGETIRLAVAELSQLRLERGRAALAGSPTDRLEILIAEREEALTEVGEQVEEYDALSANVSRADRILANVEQQLVEVRALGGGGDPSEALLAISTVREPIVPLLIRGVGLGVIGGFLLAAGALALLETLLPAGVRAGRPASIEERSLDRLGTEGA